MASPSQELEILVVGAGAVGAFYASRLRKASTGSSSPAQRVSVICRSNYQAVRAADGFSVSSPNYGDYHFTPDRIFANPDEARRCGVLWDYIIVATKALPDAGDDTEMLEGLVGFLPERPTSIVLIQNGLGVEKPYRRRFGGDPPILSGVTIISAAQPKPGHIQHNRWTRLSLGPYLPPEDQTTDATLATRDRMANAANDRFIDMLRAGGIKDAEPHTHNELQLIRWHKCALNAAFNPSSVLAGGAANVEMAEDEEVAKHAKGVMEEVLEAGARVLGLLPESSSGSSQTISYLQRPLDTQDESPAVKVLKNHGLASPESILASTRRNKTGSKPSMWTDWESGKRMELEVILGNPIRIAREELGLEMPRLQSLYALLKMAQGRRDDAKDATKEKGKGQGGKAPSRL